MAAVSHLSAYTRLVARLSWPPRMVRQVSAHRALAPGVSRRAAQALPSMGTQWLGWSRMLCTARPDPSHSRTAATSRADTRLSRSRDSSTSTCSRGHVTSSPPTTAHLGVEGGQEAPHHGVDVAHVPPRHPGQLLRGAEVQLGPAAGQLAQLPAQLPVSRPQLVVEPHHPAGPVQLVHQLQVGADARGVALVGVELLARAGVVAEGHHLAGHTLHLSPSCPLLPLPTCWPPPLLWASLLQVVVSRLTSPGPGPGSLRWQPHCSRGSHTSGPGLVRLGASSSRQLSRLQQDTSRSHRRTWRTRGRGDMGQGVTSIVAVAIMQEQ